MSRTPLSSPTPKAFDEVARKKTKKKLGQFISESTFVVCTYVDDGGMNFLGS